MTIGKRLSLPDYIATGFLALYLIIGIFIAADYGVNWDDDAQHTNGLRNWHFLTGENKQELIASSDKYHGPAFEIALIAVERGFHLTDYHDIFLARHRCSFIVYLLGIGMFFLLCRKLFNNSWLGLAGMLMLTLSPRIFGEGFYNPKDTIFLVAIAAALYSLLVFIEKPTYPRALFHAFVCAFMIDIRVIGIIFIPITLVLIGLNLYQNKIQFKGLWPKLLIHIVAEFGLMILMWPILMTGPAKHLLAAYKQLSDYTHWDGLNKYCGGCVPSLHTPWHYHWLWMLISLPEVYIILFIAGVFLLFRNALKKGFLYDTKNVILSLSLLLFLFPLVFRSIKGSSVYDGWRHVYFVYPFMIVLAIYAVERLYAAQNKLAGIVILIVLCVSLADSTIQIAMMHPFEYVYFNHTANTIFKPIDRSFEMDYWGVSYKQGLEYLLSRHQGERKIKVAFQNYPGGANYNFLKASQREQFAVTDTGSATYLLANNRDYDVCPNSYTIPGRLIDTLTAQGNKILGIYRLR